LYLQIIYYQSHLKFPNLHQTLPSMIMNDFQFTLFLQLAILPNANLCIFVCHIVRSLPQKTCMFRLYEHMYILQIFQHLALLCKSLVSQVTPEKMHLKT
jgi:hypothetical protein